MDAEIRKIEKDVRKLKPDVESDGEKIRMQSVAMFAPAQVLTDEQLKQLNS